MKQCQKLNLNANCRIRGGLALKICPIVALGSELDGLLNCVWLNRLNPSTRNCSFHRSDQSGKFLNAEMSQLLIPGPRRGLRADVPKKPGAETEKQLVLKYSRRVLWPRGRVPLQVRLARTYTAS